jgi:hypothetical protein
MLDEAEVNARMPRTIVKFAITNPTKKRTEMGRCMKNLVRVVLPAAANPRRVESNRMAV